MSIFTTISGGGIRFHSLLVTFSELLKGGVRPTTGAGVSAGAIVMLLYYADKIKEGLEIGRKTHDINIISSRFNRLFNSKGGVSKFAVLKLISGKNYVSKMDNLKKNIESVISEEDWVKAKIVNSDLNIYVHCIEEHTHRKISFNLKELNREEAINWVLGSCAVAFATPVVKISIKGIMYKVVDGGHRDSSAGSFLMEESKIVNPRDFDECISIWARESSKTYNVSSGEKVDTAIHRIVNAWSMSQRENSLNDERLERNFCAKHGKKYSPLYVKTKVENPYGMTKQQALDAESTGVEVAKEYLNKTV